MLVGAPWGCAKRVPRHRHHPQHPASTQRLKLIQSLSPPRLRDGSVSTSHEKRCHVHPSWTLLDFLSARVALCVCVCVGCVWHVQIQPIAWHGCCFSSASTAADTCSAADPAQAQLTLLKCSCPSPCSQSQPSNSGINASPTVSTPRTGPVTSRSKKCESSCPWTPMPIPSP